jgi:hypothetical protein
MNAAILGAVVPAATAVGVYVLVARLLTAETAQRYAAALAFGIAFAVGYGLLSARADLIPKRHWHWIPYLALGAAVLGPIGAARGLGAAERWLLSLLAALGAAALLVPHWASLKPPRTTWVPVLTAYLGLLAALLEPLAGRVPARTLLAAMALAAACVAALIAGFVSLTYARPALSAVAALAGCWVACWFGLRFLPARGLGLAYAVVVGGWAFVGCIDPPRPLAGLLVAPAAPLALWACVRGPIARASGLPATAARIAAVLRVLGTAAGLVLASGAT